MASKSSQDGALGCGVVVVIALIAALVSQCSGSDDHSDTPSAHRSSAVQDSGTVPAAPPSANTPTQPTKSARPRPPKKVTLSLAEIADTPGTFEQFKEFVAKYGTAEQKKAVKHLKGWRGYKRKLARPALEARSDYPTVDYEAIDGGDLAEQNKMLDLEKQGQYVAEAFAAWWKIDETAVLQVYDRGGEYAAGTACIRPDTVEKEGSCL
ncbi:hypothetical protein ACFRCW_36130 [Streptomyces sp. NPDC056653]|uniref:hypothetical protein n=1 Tax=Streptomyces sp. NPDC056653 TaxID=3345894 RepID=UPI003698B47F